jgi:hypothetical protein
MKFKLRGGFGLPGFVARRIVWIRGFVESERSMSLQFIGEVPVYFPHRQFVKLSALSGGAVVECYATRDALAAMGCDPYDDAMTVIRKFEVWRLDFEIAALVKHRRSLTPMAIVTVTAADLEAASTTAAA